MTPPSPGKAWTTWITDLLAVGPAPLSHDALDDLHRQGVRAILNLCAEFTDLHTIEAAHGFEVYHFPIQDEAAPDLDDLENALAWLDEALYLGKKTYIHCRHGIGRTGTVLNAYLLRRGLGHGRAWWKLRKLSAQPANYNQWRAVRRYGITAPRLTVRTPSVEFKSLVDLSPFFADYRNLVHQADEAMGLRQEGTPSCGRDHSRCCMHPPRLSLIEAAHLHSVVNTLLDRERRLQVMETAAGQARAGSVADKGQREEACPLLLGDACLVYDLRPLGCRTSDLPPGRADPLWAEVLAPALHKLSGAIHFVLAGAFMPGDFPLVDMAQAVSGRYVQLFFDSWRKGVADGPPTGNRA